MTPEQANRTAHFGKIDKVTVLEFIDKNTHTVVSENGLFVREDHNLGIVPGWVYQSFGPNEDGHGLSLFEDQVTFQVAISQLLSLKLAAADRNVNPIYWAKGHVGTIKLGPNVLNKLSPNGEMGVLPPPPNLLQVDRDINQLMALSRIMNRNPEARQGEVAAKGTYQSAKTLEQLSEAIDTVIGQYWDLISVGMQHMFAVGFGMEETNWPDEEKMITTNVKNRFRRDKYVPSEDIAGRRYLNVEYGFGVEGYQGFLMNLQAHGAGMKSRKTVMEAMPGVSDVDKEMREIELEEMDKAGGLALQQQAAAGQLDVVQWGKMRDKMSKDGKMLYEVVIEMEQELQTQAQQSVQEGGAQALTVPPEGAAPVQQDTGPPPGLPPSGLV